MNPPSESSNGLVIAAFRRHYLVELDDGTRLKCVLKGRSTTLACGDRVGARRVAGGGAIESVAPRTSLLYRSDGFKEKLIAANVTQVVGVVAPDVAIDENLLNRWIVAAEAERCRFLLIANKADLPDFAALQTRLAPYEALGYPVVPIAAKRDVTPLWGWLERRHSVLIGQSGMGKSTLINALLPAAMARTAEISDALVSGRHTTTSTTLYRLPSPDTWIVDSPGMKVFGLAHCAPEVISHAFVELRELVDQCRFRDCHHDQEPGCAVLAAVAAGGVAPQRVALLRTLMRESEAAHGATH